MDTKAAFDREAFEAKLIEWWPQAKGNIVRDGDDYANHFMSYAWWGWKESRAAIEIDLPYNDVISDETDGQWEKAVDACSEAITSHGIRIKGKTE